MPKFLTIGYGDRAGYDRTPKSVRDAAHANDARMVEGGAIMGMAGPPTQVRNPDDGGTLTTPGPYMSADLPVAGFGLVEADDLEEAIALVAKSPCAVAHGVIEVWPLQIAERPEPKARTSVRQRLQADIQAPLH